MLVLRETPLGPAVAVTADLAHRVTLPCPPELCLYQPKAVDLALAFFERIDHFVFERSTYLLLDFTDVKYISAAAALVLFAKITRCQCTVSVSVFKHPDQVITIKMPVDKDIRLLFKRSGLYSAIKPGGEKKLQRLWGDVESKFRSGSNPPAEMAFVIGILTSQFKVMPTKIVAAVQETYLNIAYHAYEDIEDESSDGTKDFMKGRWWQYAIRSGDKISILVYDMGLGIPSSMSRVRAYPNDDSSEILNAMGTGVTSSSIQGRGMGFDNIKKPIDLNATAQYLSVYSGKGRVVYRAGSEPERREHGHSVGGTLIEWIFLEKPK